MSYLWGAPVKKRYGFEKKLKADKSELCSQGTFSKNFGEDRFIIERGIKKGKVLNHEKRLWGAALKRFCRFLAPKVDNYWRILEGTFPANLMKFG